MRGGSISQAARSVGRTQPAVSTMISNLEVELGVSLFVREQGKLIPTPEARFFLEECESILERVDRTERAMLGVRKLYAGSLRIACLPSASNFFVPKMLTAFLSGKDDLDIALIMRSSDVIEDLIASQQFDVGFAETPKERASVQKVDFELECVCAVPKNDPLASKKLIRPQDLDGKPMGILFEGHTSATQTENAFIAEGCRLNKRLELRTFMPGLDFVSTGACYLVCDMITAYSHVLSGNASSIVFRPFRPRVTIAVSVLTPGFATPSLVAQAFRDRLIDEIETMQKEMVTILGGEC